MAYRAGVFGGVFFVKWRAAPTSKELAALLPQLEAANKRLGAPLGYLTIVTAEAPVPNADERQALEEYAKEIRRFVDHSYLVIEGEGFKASIQRSVIIGLTFWKERGYTSIYKTVDEALHRMAARTGVDYATLAAGARANELLP
jgi:hypothetical protein